MREFKSIEQFNISGRGTVYVVENNQDNSPGPAIIDGKEVEITGVESYFISMGVKPKRIGLLAKPLTQTKMDQPKYKFGDIVWTIWEDDIVEAVYVTSGEHNYEQVDVFVPSNTRFDKNCREVKAFAQKPNKLFPTKEALLDSFRD